MNTWTYHQQRQFKIYYEIQLLHTGTPMVIIVCKRHRTLIWGQVKLKQFNRIIALWYLLQSSYITCLVIYFTGQAFSDLRQEDCFVVTLKSNNNKSIRIVHVIIYWRHSWYENPHRVLNIPNFYPEWKFRWWMFSYFNGFMLLLCGLQSELVLIKQKIQYSCIL